MPRDRKLPEHFAEVRDILRIRIGVPAAIRDDLRHPYRGKRELIKSLGTGCLLEVKDETLGRYLVPGDEVVLRVERLGALRTPIVARPEVRR